MRKKFFLKEMTSKQHVRVQKLKINRSQNTLIGIGIQYILKVVSEISREKWPNSAGKLVKRFVGKNEKQEKGLQSISKKTQMTDKIICNKEQTKD